MNVLSRILKEPLLHFLAFGFLLFLVFEFVASDERVAVNSKTIVVDRDTLLTFIQYRSKAFEPNVAAARLDEMSSAEFQFLVKDYVREEALHREALALSLENDDYVIRRRLVQKLEFIVQGFANAATHIDPSTLSEFFEQNKAQYYIEPFITFTHVFFDAEKRGGEQALSVATQKLSELNAERAPFSDAPRHGDRFPYLLNYVERTPDYVISHFGKEMTDMLFSLEPTEDLWYGPYASPYGAHVVKITRQEEGRYPALEEVEGRVSEDAKRADARELLAAAIDDIVKTYEVRLSIERNSEADLAQKDQ